MQTNEGRIDRIVRAVVGVALIAGALAVGIGSVGGIILVVVGGVLAVTAATGFCPLYRVLGLSTASARK
jgi:uncharacterized membrane protein